jgi:5'-nucleotidase
MRFYYNSDIALMAGGTMRGDQIYPAGVLTLRDVVSCFPFEDPCVVIRVSGSALLAALENSVSKVPALEGRFCQVSGLEFGYDPFRASGNRVRWVKIKGEELRLDERYSIATRGYMAHGKDGFESLKVGNGDAEETISEEHGVLISTIIRQYFLGLKVISRWKRGASISALFSDLRRQQTESGVLAFKERGEYTHSESTETSDVEDEITQRECMSPSKRRSNLHEDLRLFELKRRVALKWEMLAKAGHNLRKNGAADVSVEWCRSVRPQVEGRINIVTS